jgi:hypothetical protein
MRHIFVLAVSIAVLAESGCSTQQSIQSQSQTQTSLADQSNAQLVIAPKVDDVPAHPLPFKGKLISGNKDELPPAVAMSLSDNSPVTFTYREELTHDDYHVPLAISALDPANLIGAPLGDIGVTAFASLSISSGDTILADYTAKEHASKSYNLYHDVTHAEVDEAARAAVRQRIDQKIYSDEDRLAKAVAAAGTQKTPTASAGQ